MFDETAAGFLTPDGRFAVVAIHECREVLRLRFTAHKRAAPPDRARSGARPLADAPVRSEAGGQPTVDDEIRPGDVARAIARKEYHQVGDLLR